MLKHRELVEFLKGTQPIADNQTAAKAVFYTLSGRPVLR